MRHSPKLILATLLVATAFLAACGQPSNKNSNYPLTIPWTGKATFTENFNPFQVSSNNANSGTFGLIYEPLMDVNGINSAISAWLATDYQWNSDDTQLTFHLRHDVKWSDGQPFTSADVLYTFNTILTVKGADANNSIKSYVKGVSAPDNYTFVVTFNTTSPLELYPIAGNTPILPQHIFSKLSDPVNDPNTNPIGTGPYLLDKFSPQLYSLKANPGYWQGKPKVAAVRFQAFDSNTSASLALQSDQIDYAGIFDQNVQDYANSSPDHHWYWYPADASMYYVNLTKAPFNDVNFRKALSAAMDRNAVLKNEFGAQMPHPTGLLLPQFQQYLDPQYANLAYGTSQFPTGNVAAAKQILDSAGYTKNSSGKYLGKDGKPITFNIDVVTGWTDAITDAQILAQNFADLGLTVKVNTIDFTPWFSSWQNGTFDTLFAWTNNGATPWTEFNGLFDYSTSAPAGTAASNDWERYNNPTITSGLHQFATTTDLNTQKQIMSQIEGVMVNEMPVIPFDYSVAYYEYSTKHFTGWPTKDNLYEAPSPTGVNIERVILHLTPKG